MAPAVPPQGKGEKHQDSPQPRSTPLVSLERLPLTYSTVLEDQTVTLMRGEILVEKPAFHDRLPVPGSTTERDGNRGGDRADPDLVKPFRELSAVLGWVLLQSRYQSPKG